MKKLIRLLLVCMALVPAVSAEAAFTPLSVNIAAPVQFPPGDFSVTGARLSALWGRHRSVYGLDFGVLGNITEQNFVGLGISGGFNWTQGSTTILGLQLAGGANINTQKTNVYGIQAAIFTNYNEASSNVVGFQISLANLSSHTTVYGAQVGIYNKALAVRGLQIGLVNVASSLSGVQIGLVNFNAAGPFKISPIINVGF